MKYDYYCEVCKATHEIEHRIKDDSPRHCPDCGFELERLITCSGGFILQGDDWPGKSVKP